MIYSVYNYGTKSYDYYDDGKGSPTHAGAPPIVNVGGLGASPENAAWRVPTGARKVGTGELPRGRIASMGEFRSGDGIKLGMLALSAFLAWRYLR